MDRMKSLARAFLAVCALGIMSNAAAGFDEALAAYRNKDYSKALAEAREAADGGDARASYLLGVIYQSGAGVTSNGPEALRWYEKAAQGRVLGAFSSLAQMHMRGDGIPRNSEKALGYARQSAQLGDPEGMFLVHTILGATVLNYFDAAGKPDDAKYNQLSKRPVSERLADIESRDMLYGAYEKGYPLASISLALAFGSAIGENNRERMLEVTKKMPRHSYAPLQGYERIAAHMATLGQTLTTPQLFVDTRNAQLMPAMVKTCGLGLGKDAVAANIPTLTGTAVSKPLSGAVYLPTKVAGYERAYLIAGEWEEEWTFKGCDRVGTLPIKFTADGFGGARMVSTQSGRDIPGLGKQ